MNVLLVIFLAQAAFGSHANSPGVRSGFDSLNVSFLGNWPFGPSYAVSYDLTRNLVFLGSGGGVYILDVSDPQNPTKVSEEIHTRGIVYGLFYIPSTQTLLIADGPGGLDVWDVSSVQSPYQLSWYPTPGNAFDIFVSGTYAYVADSNGGLRIINVSTPQTHTK